METTRLPTISRRIRPLHRRQRLRPQRLRPQHASDATAQRRLPRYSLSATPPPTEAPPTSPGEAAFAAPTSSFVGGAEATIEFDPSEAIKYDSLKEQLLKILGPDLSKTLKKDVQFDL